MTFCISVGFIIIIFTHFLSFHREEELSKLSADLEKQPKLASRRSYIQRIEEITKNSRKQDIDIERILKDTRDLQLESNSIQDRLNRTYAVVDETIFRYNLLISASCTFPEFDIRCDSAKLPIV